MFGLMGVARMKAQRRGGDLLQQVIASMFSASEQGALYDPSDMSTLFQDSAGTTPVTAVEQPVGRILDLSGNGNHATQATAASRPILRQTAGGLYYLEFDGVDDSLATASVDFTATDKMTVVAGVRKLSDVSRSSFLTHNSTGVNSFGAEMPNANGASNALFYAIGNSGRNPGFATGLVAAITSIFSAAMDVADVGVSSLRLNGVLVSSSSAALTGAAKFTNASIHFGRRSGIDLPFNGRLYSLIIRGAASTAAQIALAEQLAAQRSGVTL